MSNIKEFKAKPRITRNQMILDIIKSVKTVVPKDDDMIDYVLVAISKNVPCYVISKMIHITDDYSPLTLMGGLEVAKTSLLSTLGYEEADCDGE